MAARSVIFLSLFDSPESSIIPRMPKRTKRTINIIIGLSALIVLAIALSFIPRIHAALAWRVENLQTDIYYFFNPPGQVVFVPTQQAQATVTPRPTTTPTSTPEFDHPVHPYSHIHTRPTECNFEWCDIYRPDAPLELLRSCKPGDGAYLRGLEGRTGCIRPTFVIRLALAVKPGLDDPTLNFITARKQT